MHDISDHLAMILDATHREPRRSCILFRRCVIVPPRHHVPCSSFDAHARARPTASPCRSSLARAPIHDRGPLYARNRLSTTPFTSTASVHLSMPAQPHADDDSRSFRVSRRSIAPAVQRLPKQTLGGDPFTEHANMLCAATAVPAFTCILRRRFPLGTEGVQLSLPSVSACIFRRLPPPPPASVSYFRC
jgi:hypothetical protein